MTDVMHPLREVAALFLRLGVTAYGGPAAHIALMREEVVQRRRWVSDRQFLDLVGAANLIPGPNSTEVAIHLGRLRGGWLGLVVAGVCFILPAALSVLVLAWAYVKYGALPQVGWALYGVKPVIIAVVAQAIWSLARAAAGRGVVVLVGVSVLTLYLLRFNEIVLLFGGGLLVLLIRLGRRGAHGIGVAALLPLAGLPVPALLLAVGHGAPVSVGTLFFTFLKIGAVLFGGGYVLLAFLRNDFVERLGWLSDQQLLDAVAIGQFTPGPVFTTATFVGYLVGSWPGAALATLGIFLPSFVFVAASAPLIPRLRQSTWASGLLDGVNAAALGLMAGVTWDLARAAVTDSVTAALALAAAVLLVRFRVNSAWLIAGGALVGIAYRLLAG